MVRPLKAGCELIPVRNVYYMLAYAFSVLKEKSYQSVATEEFENSADLCAALLQQGVQNQLKRGLGREYLSLTELTSSPRGKVDVSASIKTLAIKRNKAVCSFDDFSVDTPLNRTIKATITSLLRADIKRSRKQELRKLIRHFDQVTSIDPHSIKWTFHFNRNNQTYQMLVAVCWLVIEGLIQTHSDGSTKMMEFFDEQRMSRLFEKFVLEYFRSEHPSLKANPSHIEWALDDGESEFLPMMKSDISLENKQSALVIDTKYYAQNTQKNFNNRTVHSANLYQIFTYVKNVEAHNATSARKISGMLLYAKTDADVQPNAEYQMSGNTIHVRTLDLNQQFSEIAAELDSIASLCKK